MNIFGIIQKLLDTLFQNVQQSNSQNFSEIFDEILKDILKEIAEGKENIIDIIKKKFQIQDENLEEKLKDILQELKKQENQKKDSGSDGISVFLAQLMQSQNIVKSQNEDSDSLAVANESKNDEKIKIEKDIKELLFQNAQSKEVEKQPDVKGLISENVKPQEKDVEKQLDLRNLVSEQIKNGKEAEKQPDVKSLISKNVKQEEKQSEQHNVKGLISEHVKPEGRQEKQPDVKSLISDHVKPEEEQGKQHDAKVLISGHVKPEGRQGEQPNVTPDHNKLSDNKLGDNRTENSNRKPETQSIQSDTENILKDRKEITPNPSDSKGEQKLEKKLENLLIEHENRSKEQKTEKSDTPKVSDTLRDQSSVNQVKIEHQRFEGKAVSVENQDKIQKLKDIILDSLKISLNSQKRKATVDTSIGGVRVIVDIQLDSSNRVSISITTHDASMRQELSRNFDDFRRFMEENNFFLAKFDLNSGNDGRENQNFQAMRNLSFGGGEISYQYKEKISYGTNFAHIKGRINFVA